MIDTRLSFLFPYGGTDAPWKQLSSPRCLNTMPRLRWFDPEPSGQPTAVDWRFPALIMATLFLNAHFWHVHDDSVWMFCPILPYTLIVAVGAVSVTALFFVPAAILSQSRSASLFSVVENSLGYIPALILRVGGGLFIVLWMANLLAVPALRSADFILRRDVSSVESDLIALSVVGFVVLTGVQSTKTTGKLALFGNKLGIAILCAASIRVHVGWRDALIGLPHGDGSWPELWQGFSVLMFYVAPLAFFAASYGRRVQSRNQVAAMGAFGFAIPLFGTVLILGVLNVATLKSPFYLPSLNPNVSMALWGHAAASALPGRMLIVAVTMFGALRFGIRALAESLSTAPLEAGVPWTRLTAASLAIAWFSVHQGTAYLTDILEATVACLIVTSAVVAADCLMQRWWHSKQAHRIDWPGVAALLAGLIYAPYWNRTIGAEAWPHTWLLPSYGVAFLTCLLGRCLQMKRETTPSTSDGD